MAERKGPGEKLAEAPKPEGFDQYVKMLELNTPQRIKPPVIRQSWENLMPLDEPKGVAD